MTEDEPADGIERTNNKQVPDEGNSRFGRRSYIKGVFAAGALVGGGAASPAAARALRSNSGSVATSNSTTGVSPRSVSKTLAPGESVTVTKEVQTPEIPALVDVFLLEDESGSFGDDIGNLQTLAPSIWERIEDSGTNFTMGVGGFRDYDRSFWGNSGDWVYRRYQDLTTNETDFLNGVNSLSASGGGDFPEGYLEALHYIASDSHAPIDSNGDGDATDSQDTPTGQAPSWRPGATRVVLLATDAPGHEEGDAGGWPGHEGPFDLSLANLITELNDAGITVVGLTPSSISTVDALATGTGGTVQPTSTSGDAVGDAIIAGLEALQTTVTPSVGPCDDGLTVTFDTASQTVTSGSVATFQETITLDSDAPLDGNEDSFTCAVDFLLDGESQAEGFVQTITVEGCAEVEVDFLADQDKDIGSVVVSEDENTIYVTYTLDGDWYMYASHLAVVEDCDDIPQTGAGNPQVGRFPYSQDHDPAVQSYTYEIDKADAGFDDDSTLCVAAHAAVFLDGNDNGTFEPDVDREESAWGDGERFTDRGNWATHFEYEVCEDPEEDGIGGR